MQREEDGWHRLDHHTSVQAGEGAAVTTTAYEHHWTLNAANGVGQQDEF